MATVSILMNCYNGEAYLKEAIDSVLAQTYKDWELIFWDNQSTDKSAEIVSSYRDDRIKYFYAPKHTLLGVARHLGLKECKSEYIAFLDADDVWEGDKLDRQLKAMKSGDYVFGYGDYDIIDKDSRFVAHRTTKHKGGYLLGDMLAWAEMGTLTVILKREAMLTLADPNFDVSLNFSGDFDLWMRMLAIGDACVLKGSLGKYRVTGSSITMQTKPRHSKEIVYTLTKLEGLYPQLYKKYEKEFAHCYMWAAMMNANYLLSIGDVKKARRSLKEASYLGGKHFRKYLLSYLPKFIALPIYKKYFEIG